MSEDGGLSQRIDQIESGYEYLLAYAAQGRPDDAGTPARVTLESIAAALGDLGTLARSALAASTAPGGNSYDLEPFFAAVENDARIARSAVGLVLSRDRISSLLVDNLNASVHLRALLTDVFLLEQASKS